MHQMVRRLPRLANQSLNRQQLAYDDLAHEPQQNDYGLVQKQLALNVA